MKEINVFHSLFLISPFIKIGKNIITWIITDKASTISKVFQPKRAPRPAAINVSPSPNARVPANKYPALAQISRINAPPIIPKSELDIGLLRIKYFVNSIGVPATCIW